MFILYAAEKKYARKYTIVTDRLILIVVLSTTVLLPILFTN